MKIYQIKANMTELQFADGSSVLFSYETPVAVVKDMTLYRTSKKWSKTTTRHINEWTMHLGKAEEREQDYFDNLVKGI